MDTTKEILKTYWGFDTFRASQENIINDVISGKDVFALLPTGGGKSLCYQLPGIIREGLTVVISPLISLMQDQVKQLNDKGINATSIYSGMSYREIDNTLDNVRFGNYDFLYVSPERIQTRIFVERFKLMNIALIVVDEAHCISQWGHDFRPAYKQIYKLRELKPTVPIAAFTATATKSTKRDVIKQLGLKNHVLHEASFLRENIAYRIFQSEAKNSRLLEFCCSLKNSVGIVYCQTRRSVKTISQLLKTEGISCLSYHGGMKNDDRKKSMDLWMNESVKIMVATNAFGMGIDKANVRFVIHYEMSESIEAYFQEAGRAGRDQKKAIALAFVDPKESEKLHNKIELKFPPVETVKNVYKSLCYSLRIAFGSGKDEVYPLNLNTLCKTYQLELLPTYNSLKLLELNGMISLSEGVFNPSKVKILVEMPTLYNFEIQHDSLKNLSQYLIRKHPGIFELYKKIDLNHISSLLKESIKTVEGKLKELHKMGIIDFVAASSLPTLSFMRERPPNDDFLLLPEIYSQKKANYKRQLQAMESLITQQDCNSKFILEYFDQVTTNCGHCNHCTREATQTKNTLKTILELCTKPTNVSWLMNLTGLSEKKINDFVNKAQNEDLITIDGKWLQKLH